MAGRKGQCFEAETLGKCLTTSGRIEDRPGPTQVCLLAVGGVHNRLRVGDVVHRGDAAVNDAQVLQDDLHAAGVVEEEGGG